MSDASQGPGWWVASDGKWYPTERHSDVNLPEPLEAPSAAGISDPTALPVLRAKGVNSEIEVSGEWITIRRKLGAKRQHQGQAETRIRIADVTGVQFRAATILYRCNSPEALKALLRANCCLRLKQQT